MSNGATTPRIPRPVPSCDVRRLPLTPAQAYVLSRVDGTVSEIELCTLTGHSLDEVQGAVDRLIELGAVAVGDGIQKVAANAEEASRVPAGAVGTLKGAVIESYTIPPAPDSSRSLYDPSELDEDVEIPPDKRRQILDLYYRLEELTYYQLLGVGETADKKDVKDAYYALAAEFHPDRYFRKNLGSFKSKMEALFSRVTLAHDTLTRKTSRAEYDEYLETQRGTRDLESSAKGAEAKRELEELRREVAGRAAVVAEASPIAAVLDGEDLYGAMDSRAAPSAPPAASPSAPPTASQPAPARVVSPAPRDPEFEKQRREALARRLLAGRSGRPPAPGSSIRPQQPAVPNRDAARNAAEDLKRRFAEKQAAARRAQLREAMKTVEEARRRDDHAMAANALRLAVELAPDDEELKRQLAKEQDTLDRALAQNYLKQARYEEKAERWREAARSYQRVAEVIKEDAKVQERAANAMLRVNGDMHVAGVFAKRAVELEPKRVDYRVTLAKVYIAAGHQHSARKELEIAAGMAPGDDNIAKLLKTLR